MKSGKFNSCKYGEDNYKSNNLFSVPSPSKFSPSGCPCVNKAVALLGTLCTAESSLCLQHPQTFQLLLLCHSGQEAPITQEHHHTWILPFVPLREPRQTVQLHHSVPGERFILYFTFLANVALISGAKFSCKCSLCWDRMAFKT